MIKQLLEEYSPQEVLAGLSTALDKSLQEIKAGSAWSSLEIKRLNVELREGVKIKRQPETIDQMAGLLETEGLGETLNAMRKELLGKHPSKFLPDAECGGNSGMLPVITVLNQTLNIYRKLDGPLSVHLKAIKEKAEEVRERSKAATPPPPPPPEPKAEQTAIEVMLSQNTPGEVASSFAAAAGPRLQPVEDCISLCHAYNIDLSTSAPQGYRILRTNLANRFPKESQPNLVKKLAKLLDAETIPDVAQQIAKAIPGSANAAGNQTNRIVRDLNEIEKVGRRVNCPIL